jgi:condensin complex subunit 1
VENAFITIYVRKNPLDTAKNLLDLAIDSNIGDLAALEFIVNALVSKGEISTSTVSPSYHMILEVLVAVSN